MPPRLSLVSPKVFFSVLSPMEFWFLAAVASGLLSWGPGTCRRGGGLWGLEPLPFFKIIQKCPSPTNSNDIVSIKQNAFEF